MGQDERSESTNSQSVGAEYSQANIFARVAALRPDIMLAPVIPTMTYEAAIDLRKATAIEVNMSSEFFDIVDEYPQVFTIPGNSRPLPGEAYLAVVDHAFREAGVAQATIDYFSTVTLPTLIALRSGYSRSDFDEAARLVHRVIGAKRAQEDDLAYLQKMTEREVYFVEHAPEITAHMYVAVQAELDARHQQDPTYAIDAVGLFGSIVRGDAGYFSDLDAVYFTNTKENVEDNPQYDTDTDRVREFTEAINQRIRAFFPDFSGVGLSLDKLIPLDPENGRAYLETGYLSIPEKSFKSKIVATTPEFAEQANALLAPYQL